jgi:hypothetical protein
MDFQDIRGKIEEKYIGIRASLPDDTDSTILFALWCDAYLQALVDAEVIPESEHEELMVCAMDLMDRSKEKKDDAQPGVT